MYPIVISLVSRLVLLALFLFVLLGFVSPARALPMVPDVRAVYLVPSDRTFNPLYQSVIGSALNSLQKWYADQLGGVTFTIHSPVVETFTTAHPAAYYASNSTSDYYRWFFDNVVSDGFAATGGSYYDPNHRWIYYIDADNAPGQFGGAAAAGVAELPGADLRGLNGEDLQPVSRWIGGLGHELGHTFGLPHPSTCEPNYTADCPSTAIMWTGYLTYPDAFLLPEDKATLLASPFFNNRLAVPLPDTAWLLALGLACLARFRLYRTKAQGRIMSSSGFGGSGWGMSGAG